MSSADDAAPAVVAADDDLPHPAPDPRGGGAWGWLACVVFVLVGLGLRMAYASSLGDAVSAWEADGFVVAWEGHPWGAWNRLRPPGTPWVLGQLGGSLEPSSRLEVRWLAIGLSALAFLAALDAASRLSRATSMTRRSVGRAAGWMAAVWAFHPTLLATSVAPIPETLLGASLCVLLAGMARLAVGAGPLGWLIACAGGAAAVLTGGLGVAAALTVGVIVFLLPIPRIGVSLAALAALALALGAGWWVQRGPDPERPWLPDTAAARSLMVLTDAPHPAPAEIPTHADLRERLMLADLAEGLRLSGGLHLAGGLLSRLVFEQLNPGRFSQAVEAIDEHLAAAREPGPLIASEGDHDDGVLERAAAGLGWFDVFVRGGLLLFVFTVVGVLRPRAESCWPRAAALVGGVALLVVLVAGAIGPFALAPIDLVLLATAGAGVAGADPSRPWTRRLAFIVGGTLLCTLLLTAGLARSRLPRWTTHLAHISIEGQQLVDLLEPPGQQDAGGEARAAELLMFPTAPLLRQPEAALEHAEAAVRADPESDRTVEILVRAQVENGLYEPAAKLAEGIRAPIGTETRKSLLLLDWVQDEQRRMLNLPRRR